jgi:nucleotide-binding universal stress UspA family protein
MKLFDKILVPVDFSALSTLGIQRAMNTATRCNCHEIHLVSVVDFNTVGYFVTAETCLPMDYQLFQNELKVAEEKMDEIKKTFQPQEGISMIYKVTDGNLVSVIHNYVEEHAIDLVVMGTSGTGGIQEFIFGSNAQHIAATIPCPLLTLQPYDDPGTIQKIIVPVETFYPENKLHYALIFAKLFSAEIHLVCLRHKLEESDKQTADILQQITAQLATEQISYKVFASVGKNITDVILRYAEKERVDLILVNPGKESKLTGKFIETTGGQIINHAHVPVLTVKKTS